MNTILAPLLRKSVLVFFDGILVYNPTYQQHLHHLKEVLELLQQDLWRVNLSKCAFAKREIAYLGHVISVEGVATCPAKIKVVADWPVPTNVKQPRSFLALAGYYRKSVHHYGVISSPLSKLLKKGVVFVWIVDHDIAFNTLKSPLISALVLALPDFSKTFYVQTGASDFGVGAVLMQEGHPLAYVSKSLGPKLRGLPMYEKGICCCALSC
jgi:hypothetical protein